MRSIVSIRIWRPRALCCTRNSSSSLDVKTKVVIFPGQGSQYRNMISPWLKCNPISVGRVLETVSAVANVNIENAIEKGDFEDTFVTQMAIFACSIANYLIVQEHERLEESNKSYFLGHSLGEFTCLAASGLVSLEETAKIIALRAQKMNKIAAKGGMLALLGKDQYTITKAIDTIKTEFPEITIANYNTRTQIVVSGPHADLSKVEEYLKSTLQNLKFINLNVHGPFHSSTYSSISEDLQLEYSQFQFNYHKYDTDLPIISNSSAKPYPSNQQEIIKLLSRHAGSAVYWYQSVESILKKHTSLKLMCMGPGRSNFSLVNKIVNQYTEKLPHNIECVTCSSPADIFSCQRQ